MSSQEGHPALVPQVQDQQIQYRQDGPRARADSFTLLANASALERRSQPRTIFISILPRSSRAPRLRLNAGLQVRAGWQGMRQAPRGAQHPGSSQPSVETPTDRKQTAGARQSQGAAERLATGSGEPEAFPGGARLCRRRRPGCVVGVRPFTSSFPLGCYC